MKILYEFVPSREFLKLAQETRDMVDGWNVTDSAVGKPAPSGTAIASVLKSKYPEKIVIPQFILRYKSPVEAGGLALAADAMGIDGLMISMGDIPQHGEPLEMLKSSEEARDFLRETIGIKETNLGCLLSGKRPVEEIKARIREDWDFFFFLRLEEDSLEKLNAAVEECNRLDKPIYPYFLVRTPRNEKMIESIGWPSTTTMEHVESFVSKIDERVDGIITTCAGDQKGAKELLERVQKFRGR